MARTGRPSTYGVEIVQSICEQIAEGSSLRTICKRPGMPALSTVMLWLNQFTEFSEQFTRGCELRAQVHAEEIIEIADDSRRDYVERKRKDGTPYLAFERDHVERAKVRIDARLRLMAAMNPKRFGQKVDVNHSGTITLEALITRSMETPAVQQHVAPTIEHEDD